MWSEFLTMGISRPGYNLLTRPFSDLATRGTPHAGLFDLGFFLVPGALIMVLGVGLWYAIRGGQAWPPLIAYQRPTPRTMISAPGTRKKPRSKRPACGVPRVARSLNGRVSRL